VDAAAQELPFSAGARVGAGEGRPHWRALPLAWEVPITAESRQQAGEGRAAASHEGEIDLLITDVVMPQMRGPALAERLRRTRPRLRVLYISGYTADEEVPQDALLPKPFSARSLAERVDSLLSGAPVESSKAAYPTPRGAESPESPPW